MSLSYRSASNRVRAFVAACHDQAVELLVTLYQNDANARDKMEAMLERAEDTQQNAPSGRTSQSTQLDDTILPSELQNQGHASLSSRRPSHRLTSSTGGPAMPFTPPRTASSVKSHGSKSGRASSKYILIASEVEGANEDEKVRFETARIPNSVIREGVVKELGLTERLDEADLECVQVPSRGQPNGFANVYVEDAVRLTWSYSNANRSHRNLFYVVADDKLDSDVVLSQHDTDGPSPEAGLRLNTHQPQQPQQPQQHDHHSISPNAYNPRLGSYHPSDYTSDRLANSMPTRGAPDQHYEQTAQRFAQEVFSGGQPRENSARAPRQSSSTANPRVVRNSREIPQSDRPRPNPAGASNDPNAADGKIRVKIDWGNTPGMLWLDMCASGEAFYQAFHKLAQKKNPSLERDETTLLLKPDKESPDDNEYQLALGADELDADWETTLEWLRENKKEKPPHIYGRVEVGDG